MSDTRPCKFTVKYFKKVGDKWIDKVFCGHFTNGALRETRKVAHLLLVFARIARAIFTPLGPRTLSSWIVATKEMSEKEIDTEELKCHSCGEITDYYCEDCDQPVCEDCTQPFTLHNQLEGTHCKDCYEISEIEEAEYYQLEEERERIRNEKERKETLMRVQDIIPQSKRRRGDLPR